MKSDDSESANSAEPAALGALAEQNVRSQLRTVIKDAASNVQSNEIKADTLTGGRDDESGTNDTNDSAGSKRKRVRHRKKKNANDENQMNLPNVRPGQAAAAAAAASVHCGGVKRDMAPAKNPFEKPQSKCNTHVR